VIRDKVKQAPKPKAKPKAKARASLALTDMVQVEAQAVAPEGEIAAGPPRNNRERASRRSAPPKIRLKPIQESPAPRTPSRIRNTAATPVT
jgi:hypothetical protein